MTLNLNQQESLKLNYTDNKYPDKLKMIQDYPKILFYKGNVDLLNRQILAIIGCRKCSNYGLNVAIDFAYKLSKDGIIIASGGARGIDSFSNMGAILAGKPTIMVLGNGLNYIYPPENKSLEEKILNNGGLIISEYPADAKPNKENFPKRNRIISAISNGVLVVEAKERSGSFITVEYALEQGKDIYAIPGNINQENSYGTNELIKQGAKPVTSVEDILEDYIKM